MSLIKRQTDNRFTPAQARFWPAKPCGHDDRPEWDLAWTYRHGRGAASSQQLVDAVRSLDLPEEPGLAYLAGEARTIQMVRRHLIEERGWPRRNVRTKPYWTPGRRGMD